jgi:hypothetical protein
LFPFLAVSLSIDLYTVSNMIFRRTAWRILYKLRRENGSAMDVRDTLLLPNRVLRPMLKTFTGPNDVTYDLVSMRDTGVSTMDQMFHVYLDSYGSDISSLQPKIAAMWKATLPGMDIFLIDDMFYV